VPSGGERNNLLIAWCNLDKNCNARYSDETIGWISWDFVKNTNWTDNNKLIRIWVNLWENINEMLNLWVDEFGDFFWTSSVGYKLVEWVNVGAMDTFLNNWFWWLTDYGNTVRMDNDLVRCFKNYITAPPTTYEVAFFNENEFVWSGDVVSWDKISEDVISWYNLLWFTKTWYTFWWWAISGSDDMFDVNNGIVTTWMILNAVWNVNQYTITFDTDWWTTIAPITADYWTAITTPSNPTKNGYTFKWWDKTIPTTMPAENMTIKAIWEKASGWSSGWWGGGWWGWWGGSSSSCKNLPTNAVANNSSTPSSNTNYYYSTNTSKICTFQCKSGYTRNAEKQTCDKVLDTQTTSWKNVKEPEINTWNNTKVETWNNIEIQTWSKVDSQPAEQASEQTHQNDNSNTQDSSTSSQNDGKTYSTEFQEAYEFAKWNWITTMSTIQEANMNGKLTRIAMAKMLSQYAMNVLWQKPANLVTPKFNDVTDKQNSDYDNWVTLSYQLGIMWQNMPNNKFRPNDEVTRAEFATALSRMVYHTSDWEYKSTPKYYIHHMEKLIKEWIVTKDDPSMKELRGYVMIMLMRSAK